MTFIHRESKKIRRKMNMILNAYFKKKLKEKKVSVEELITKSKTSKSTIYRVMNGLQKPSEDLKKKLFKILKMEHKEQQELSYLFSTFNVDKNILEARESINNFLFHNKIAPPNKIELVYYDGEKYVRSFNDILENIKAVSHKSDFSCRFKMVNCVQNDIISHITSAVEELLAKNDSNEPIHIEHIVAFSSNDYKENINTLSSIIPLLTLGNYTLKYKEEEKTSKHGFFHDFLSIDFSYRNDAGDLVETAYYITFLPDNLSVCYVVHGSAGHLHDFFNRNYDSLNQKNQSALSSRRCLVDYASNIRELYSKYNDYLFRPDIPLSRIPLDVYQSVLSRTPTEEFIRYFLQVEFDEKTPEHYLEELTSCAQSVIEATYINKQVDFYTKTGLESFASSGLLLDHLEHFPPLNKSEIKAVLESLKARDLDPKDPLSIMILDESYVDNGLEIAALEDYGLLIEKYADSNTPYCIIENKNLSKLFVDYAKHYVPYKMSITQKEAHDFIDLLIEKYCS